LLLVHGKGDTRLPHRCSEQIYAWAREPKELVLYEGAEHSLRECDGQLHDLLAAWLPAKLTGA
jgi:alpha-beta hydrolase superfamily lysophospholipase